ncbi:MAG: PDC sensor domain-containing protein, partial [Oceanobacter sp.]
MKRQLWVSSVFIAVAAGFSGWLVGTTLIDQQIKELKRKASVALTVEATESEGYLENTTRLLQVLATSEEIKQALLSLDTAIEQLEPTFKRVIKAYPTLHQIRWIDETGKEQIRHQRDGTLVYQIPEFELQNKSDRYYFQEAIARSYGNIYFSPIDLNVEHGAIETPYRPMIRIAARVADSEGRARGILIANDSMRGWFEDLPGRRSEKHYWVVNHEGDWLRSDIAEQE